jgi:hypothetical protein
VDPGQLRRTGYQHRWDENKCVQLLWDKKAEGKTIPVRGRGGSKGCETSRLSHFLDNRLTDGGEVVSLTCQTPFTPRKIPGTHFCYRLSQPQCHNAAGRIRSIDTFDYLIGDRIRACSMVPQSTTLPYVEGLLKTTNFKNQGNKKSLIEMNCEGGEKWKELA